MQNFLFHLQQCTRCCIEFVKKHSSFIECQLFFKMSQISQRLVFMKKTTTNLDTSTVNTVEYSAINCSLRKFSGQKNKRIKIKCFLGLMAPPLILVRPQKSLKHCLHSCRLYCKCSKFGTAENYPPCTVGTKKKSPLKIPSITSCLFLRNQDGQIGYKIDIEKYIIFFQFKKQTIFVVSKRS